jgi:Cu-Zn family superoxide dismutase
MTANTPFKRVALAACFGALAFTAACTSTPAGPSATAQLQPTTNNTARGSVTFEQRGDKVLLTATVEGLKPGQEHGFHLHEKGDCSSGDGLSTGGHFNPNGKPHGPQHADHHAGDLPALKADASGRAELRAELQGVSVAAGTTSVVGRGLIVHAGPDDYTTQPTGNSGARIACGVVKAN